MLLQKTGILLIANSLLIGFLLYYAARFMLSNFTFQKILENLLSFIKNTFIYIRKPPFTRNVSPVIKSEL